MIFKFCDTNVNILTYLTLSMNKNYIYIKLSLKQTALLLDHLDTADEAIFGTDIYIAGSDSANNPTRKAIKRIVYKINSYLDESLPQGF